MRRDSAVDGDDCGFGFSREIRFPDRAFHLLDPDLRTIDDFGQIDAPD